MPAYVSALCKEIGLVTHAAGERLPVHTIFFGGGTPSLLPVADLERILQTLERDFIFANNIEITLEANPGTVSACYMQDIHALGVNRISLGMQSAHPHELRMLDRQHTQEDVVHVVNWARLAGLDNLNLDLIFGLPSQDFADWQHSLEVAVGLNPEHLSLYALNLEPGTPLHALVKQGMLDKPDADNAADMYEWAMDRLAKTGYQQYEISNWARRISDSQGYQCVHNLQYWRNANYLGFGAGAHGYTCGVRLANVNHPSEYIRRCLDGEEQGFPRSPATATVQEIDRQMEMGETMMMGLRLVEEGVSVRNFQTRFGFSLSDSYGQAINSLVRKGLLEWIGEEEKLLRLTRWGRLLGNQVFMEFI